MIVHVDMDAFYTSVEQLDNLELKGQCVIVGGTSNRGVVSAASYEARKFGVHSAMPIYQARQKCPHAVYLPPRFQRYHEISCQVMTVLESFSPLVEQVSIDEAFLDISGCGSIYGSPQEIGKQIKEKIFKTVGLTCSVGIAPLKFLAKIASDLKKPDGLTFISPDQVDDFIRALPVGKVPGVGPQTEKQLQRLGINTLGDVKRYSEKQIITHFGKYGYRLYELASGIDRSIVQPDHEAKSIGSEETLPENTSDRPLLKRYLLKQSEDVGHQLRQSGLKAATITIKIKFADFTQKTHQTKLNCCTNSSEILYRSAAGLLDAFRLNKSVRLIGMSASDFDSKDKPVQLCLFKSVEENTGKWEKVDHAVDSISEKFGREIIKKAVLKEDE